MSDKPNKNITHRDETAAEIVGISKVSANLVRKVIRGDRENEVILSRVMAYKEGKSLLLKTIEELIPF